MPRASEHEFCQKGNVAGISKIIPRDEYAKVLETDQMKLKYQLANCLTEEYLLSEIVSFPEKQNQ